VPKLDDTSVATALASLPEWRRDGDALVRTYRRRDWLDAIALLNAIAAEAQRRDHHPDVWIERYNRLTIRLTSHDSGGVTQRDVNLATWIETAAQSDVAT
jgi:4a-hydroxytetrahydrobiopterin dehydratase